MSRYSDEQVARFYALTYDVLVSDWPGEIAFYQQLAAAAGARGRAVLEVACGTGRVAGRLAQAGGCVVGLDLSAPMLEVAREKSAGMANVRWVEAELRAFDLGETFGLVLIPGHAFQNLTTAADQVACLTCIRRHLVPGGLLVVHLDHQDLGWLGALPGESAAQLEEEGRFLHPTTGRAVQAYRSWAFEAVDQTAVARTVWEEMDAEGEIVARWDTGPIRLHCVFRFEMEHLLARAGFEALTVYGDFYEGDLKSDSSDMVWVAATGTATRGVEALA